ncbi:unnamed protein product [Schistosoma rodhaini]|uniref:Cytoplasmic tRNA 2-thiolation protein 2 n=1 Tax=Schistosoma mansoni TaxID=6183 RepID=G4VJ82_SCHMA|nr:hypothetical protein Smp_090690 [Schistosoma mansoni]CAH8644734.1 unnamed protein product [Schistosoma rodhaini]|eukprot:XP_018652087.1 hypothetical protein Smp_090690 [Schistosoma mansoni]
MCNQEEDCSCLFTSISKKKERISHCIKCQSPPAVLIRKDDPSLCKSCFINQCYHKINTIFGKYKLNSIINNMAIAYSGGQNSSTLLKLILKDNDNNGIMKRNPNNVPKVFHLVESSDSQANLELITKIMKNTGLEYYNITLDEITEVNEKWTSQLTSSSLSNKQRYHDYYRLNLLIKCTKKLNCKYLMMGDCSNRMTVKYLLEIIEGRGNYSSLQTSFLDERYQDITIVRPLRDFLAKEIALFAHFIHLEYVTPNDPLTSIVLKNPNVNTLERLTQDFLSGLQAGGFPSTTGTILRTSSKIVLENDSKITCRFCHFPISNTDSSNDPDRLATESMIHSSSLSNPDSFSEKTVPGVIEKDLCLSCSLMFKDLSVCT